jgi:SNF2 family DNA or RNA helicase
MKVATTRPFQLIYSVFQHEYLGYLFESFVVQLDDMGRLTLQNQNISAQNAQEFSQALDETDYKLISLMDSMQQNSIIKRFYNKKVKPSEVFSKVYTNPKDKTNQLLIEEIERYLETRRSQILQLINGKMLFEMGKDGEPTWRQLEMLEEKATVLFHFRRNEDNTHYFPTIKHAGQKVNFQYNGSYIICKNPAWLVIEGKLYSFEKDVDGHKLLPFLNKKFIMIPRKVEDTYYRKFVAPLIGAFDVYAVGFDIVTEQHLPVPIINFSEIVSLNGNGTLSLFDKKDEDTEGNTEQSKILFELTFKYGNFSFRADHTNKVNVFVDYQGERYTFFRIRRNLADEKLKQDILKNWGLELKHSKTVMEKPNAFAWLNDHIQHLNEYGFIIQQNNNSEKRYFLGQSSIKIEIVENIDWFDLFAIVNFGEFQIPFIELRRAILKKRNEIILPNGEVAVIPGTWIERFSELFAFANENKSKKDSMILKKHHLALVNELGNGEINNLMIDRKLQKLKHFEQIDDFPIPYQFKGELRPYQKAGYDWLQFLSKYNFGGCLADDMGLGKTVQTLAMLQSEKEKGAINASLLIMPTSLIYNWENEAKKFTPDLKVFSYKGTNRLKDPAQFNNYDLILTSYGIARLDIDLLKEYYFNYVILDESQAIKNPGSIIAKAVKKLRSKNRLVLTGTPLENSAMDLWSQMTFLNPGLLGSQHYFINEFLKPIEKKKDENKTRKLNSIIKPFLLRRHKSQVATELPEKVINIQYCAMSPAQEEEYEKAKTYFRNKILEVIEDQGVRKSQFLVLQGLNQLRQLANHPRMVIEDYKGDSGKLEDVTNMISNGISEGHKILVFSQFVKHLTIVKDYLKASKIAFSYLDGSTRDRQAEVENFQNDEDIKIFLISLKAGGLGLNLTRADYVFLLDPWWNPAVEAQAMDRAHRIGQEKKVFTYKFISKDTVEEKIVILQERKIQLAQNLITTEESFVKDLSKEDIRGLFE